MELIKTTKSIVITCLFLDVTWVTLPMPTYRLQASMRSNHFSSSRRMLLASGPALLLSREALAQNPPAMPAVQAPAWTLPVWTAQGPASRELSSRELLGQWVYLDFWASWCGPCKQSFPWMGQLQSQLQQPLQVVAIGLDKQAAPMERFLKQFPGHVPVVWDPQAETAKRFDVQAMPSSYLINPAGQMVMRHRGFMASEGPSLLQAIRSRMSAA